MRGLHFPARAIAARGIEGMHPAYFAMSMATGIVSLATQLLGLDALARMLFWINVAAYVALWSATLARALAFPAAFAADVGSHARSPGFFTTVAATGILGVQCALLGESPRAAVALFWACAALWVLCTYGVFVALSIKRDKPGLEDGMHGGWLLAVVGTQSVCVLGCNVIEWLPYRDTTLFLLVSFWACGGMLYIWMISLIFYRYTFFRFEPTDLMPPYWINMGAVAISTLAGALLARVGGSPLLASLQPFLRGFTILYWATATWWIPMLVILGLWRHAVRRVALEYDPLYWGMVFPLGMYSVCTQRLSLLLDLPFLLHLSRAFMVAAVVAWLLASVGMGRRLLVLVPGWGPRPSA